MSQIQVLAGLAALVVFNVIAQSPEQIEWITDPAELAVRGFDPDGPPIQRLIPVDDSRPLAEQLAERAELRAGDVGGTSVKWASVQATDFQLLGDGAAYGTLGNFQFSCLEGSPTNMFADAAIHFRDNRRLEFLDVWTHDSSSDWDVSVDLYRACQPDATAGAPVVTELASRSSSGNSGNQFTWVSIPGPVITDNRHCVYWVRARFQSCAAGSALAVYKARVIWD